MHSLFRPFGCEKGKEVLTVSLKVEVQRHGTAPGASNLSQIDHYNLLHKETCAADVMSDTGGLETTVMSHYGGKRAGCYKHAGMILTPSSCCSSRYGDLSRFGWGLENPNFITAAVIRS